VLPARADLLRLMGYLAGKWPHSLALQPGGTTRAVTATEKVRLLAVLREFRAFLSRTVFGDALENVAAIGSADELAAWAQGRPADFPRFLEIAGDLGLARVGRASDSFLSYGAYSHGGERRPASLCPRRLARTAAIRRAADQRGRRACLAARRAAAASRGKAKRARSPASLPTRPAPTPGARRRATTARSSRPVRWPARWSPASRCCARWWRPTAAACWRGSSPACSNSPWSYRRWSAGCAR
jgi:hypothetical protein